MHALESWYGSSAAKRIFCRGILAGASILTLFLINPEEMTSELLCLFLLRCESWIKTTLWRDELPHAEVTQIQTMTGTDLSDMIMLPCEWKRGDPVITWPKHHQYFNIHWLENTWKFIRKKMPNDLSPLENYNLLYINNPRERYFTLYRISPNQSTILHCSKEQLADHFLNALHRTLQKLDITVIDSFPDIITGHADFSRYVPKFDPVGLLRVFRNRISQQYNAVTKLSQEINSLLSEKEVASIRTFLAACTNAELAGNENMECLKQLPLFENATSDAKEKYISLAASNHLCYEGGPHMPALPINTGSLLNPSGRSVLGSSPGHPHARPCILVRDQDSRKLLEKMNQRMVDFSVAARQLIMSLPDCFARHGSVSMSGGRGWNSSHVGKWLLAHCGRLLLTDNLCQDCVRPLRLFPNQAMDLCSASQLIDPSSADRYNSILTSRMLPLTELCSERYLGLLRSLGMRSIHELKGEDIVEICECSRSAPDARKRLLASLLVEVLSSYNSKALLSEPVIVSGGARCTVKVFLYSFPWMPVASNRPKGYPLSLPWKYSPGGEGSNLFMAPQDILEGRKAFIGGSEMYVADFEVRSEHVQKFGFKSCGVGVIVRHLKTVVRSYGSMTDRSEYLDYLNLTKEIYEALQTYENSLTQAELHANDLKEWIWNGDGGFSSPESIFLMDKNHPLAQYFTTVPYEMYSFVGFFESMGVRRNPLVSVILNLLNDSSFKFDFWSKPYEAQSALLNLLYENYSDRRVLAVVSELEQTLVEMPRPNSTGSAGNPQTTKSLKGHDIGKRSQRGQCDQFGRCGESPQPSAFVVTIDPSMDQAGVRDLLKTAISTVKNNTEIVIHVGPKPPNGIDHYQLYDEILFPQLNMQSRNVKDSLVLLALDNCDAKMMCILRRHLCIPVTPNGHNVRRPGEIVHPKCLLSSMYSDVEGAFPYGSADTFLRKDRLNVLRLLGMKFDEVSWTELAERAKLAASVEDPQGAYERALGVVSVLRVMLSRCTPAELNNDELRLAFRRMSECAFYPVMGRPCPQYPLQWLDRTHRARLARPCDLVSHKHWPIASSSYSVCLPGSSDQEAKLLGFHEPTVADALVQLAEISKLASPLSDDVLETGCVRQVAEACYTFIVQQSRLPDFNQTSVVDFFSRNRALLSNNNLYFSNQVFTDMCQSVPPYFISLSCSGLPTALLRFVLAVQPRPTVDQVLCSLRNACSHRVKETAQNWTTVIGLFSLLGDLIEHVGNSKIVVPDSLPIPDLDGNMHPLSMYRQSGTGAGGSQQRLFVHPAVDYRFRKYAMLDSLSWYCMSGRMPLRNLQDEKLQDLLERIDHPSIDQRLREALSDTDPNIILEFVLAADKARPIKHSYSCHQAKALLDYFDGQLSSSVGNFQKLRELCLFQNVWSSKDELTSIDQYKQVFMVSRQMAHLLTSLFDRCPPLHSANPRRQEECCVLVSTAQSYFSSGWEEVTNCRILSHLHIVPLKDVDAFLQLCLPYFADLVGMNIGKILMALRHVYDHWWPSLSAHEQSRLQEILASRLLIPNRQYPPEICLCSTLFHPKQLSLLEPFIDVGREVIHCQLEGLADLLPLRHNLPASRFVELSKEIESQVNLLGGWTEPTRARSRHLYDLLVHCKGQMDELSNANIESANVPFLEPYLSKSPLSTSILPVFEHSRTNSVVLAIRDGLRSCHADLAWSASYVLPDFVQLDCTAKLTPQLVLRHLSNLAEALSSQPADSCTSRKCQGSDATGHDMHQALMDVLRKIYEYFEEYIGGGSDKPTEDSYKPAEVLSELQCRKVVYTERTQQFVEPHKACIRLAEKDEIPPFLYAVSAQLTSIPRCLQLFQRIGCLTDVSPELYANILCKMARVCHSDYLNSNEIRKVLRASNGLFRAISRMPSPSGGFRFDGLFLLTNQLKLKKSCDVVVMDQRQRADYITKLPDEQFLFNPNECVLSLDDSQEKVNLSGHYVDAGSTTSYVRCLEKIALSQRPTLFSDKYEETFSVVIQEDGQRQRVLHALERKFTQLINSRTLHRSLARMLADAMARSKTDMRIVSVDEMEVLLRSRLSLVRLICCEHLETCLVNKANQQKIEGTAEERAVLLTDVRPDAGGMVDTTSMFTLYMNFKHAEQSYFSLCMTKAMLPLFADLKEHMDQAVFSSLMSCSIAHMSRVLDLLGMCTDENILSTLKLNYVPGPGRLYGDEITLLANYTPQSHRLVPGDLCVFRRVADSAFVYCKFVRLGSRLDSVVVIASEEQDDCGRLADSRNGWSVALESRQAETEICYSDFFVLENWTRIHDAVGATPMNEKEFDQHERTYFEKPGGGQSGEGADSQFLSNVGSLSDLNEEERLQLESAKSVIDCELREVYLNFGSNGMEDRKKRIKRLLLKWHPDKNQGNEKFASEVFKHLKKQIELLDIEQPQSSLGSFSSLFTNFNWSSAFTSTSAASGEGLFSSSKFGGSFDNLNVKSGDSTSSSQRYSPPHFQAGDEFTHTRSHSGTTTPPSRSNSFRTAREEWQWRRQQGFGRRAGLFTEDNHTNSTFAQPTSSNLSGADDRRKGWPTFGGSTNGSSNQSSNGSSSAYYQQMSEAQRWLKQSQCDLASANNDMCPAPPGTPSFEWVCYKCYRAAEKALKAYHHSKSPGKILASDIPTLLFGVDNEIRSVGYRLYKWLGDPNRMQYPNVARFLMTPSEVFTATQAEKSLEYSRELLRKIEEIITPSQDCT